MSLSKQIGLVFSFLLVLLLGGVLGLYFFKSKAFLEKQLTANTDAVAHILAETLHSALEARQPIEKIIDRTLQNTSLTFVEVKKINDHTTLYKKTIGPSQTTVPAWFSNLLSIKTPSSEVIVETDNGVIVKLKMKADPSKIYLQLYELFLYTIILFLIFGAIGLILINMTLTITLASLKKLREQATGIIYNRFIVQKEIPLTAEFREVTQAMNTMIKRVKELYERNARIMRESQETLYHDHVTGLFNRRYFQLKLPEYLLANDTRSRGVLMMLRLENMAEANRRIGHDKLDDMLHNFTKMLIETCDKAHEPIIARINGSEFALLVPVYNIESAKTLGNDILSHYLPLSERYGIRKILDLKIGICNYHRKMQPSTLLTCVDTALSEASRYSDTNIVAHTTEDTNRLYLGKNKWREIITKALKEGRIKPSFTPVHDLKREKESAHYISFDLIHEGKIIRYADYISAIVELGMEYEVMQYEFDYMKNHHFQENAISFELIAAELLQKSDKLFILEENIKEIAEHITGKFFLEISEHDLLSLQPIVVEKISIALKTKGVRLSINRFMGDRGEYSYLKYSAPAYVKMSENSFFDLDDASKNALLTLLGSLGIEIIIVDVHTENIPQLEALSIRYIMYGG